MAFLRGVSYGQPDQSSGPDVPVSAPSIVSGSNAGSMAPGVQSSNAQLPSSVLQNIGQYNAGPTGSMVSAYNQTQGLQNYNNLANQYGGGSGWTPWALQDQSAGGYGQNPYQAQNLFLGNNPQSISAGNQFTLNPGTGNLSSYQIMHNPYSGQRSGYGDMQNILNPLGGAWNNAQTPGSFNSYFDLSKYGIDPNSQFNQGLNMPDWQRAAFQNSNPGYSGSQSYTNYSNYGNAQGYGNFSPYTPTPVAQKWDDRMGMPPTLSQGMRPQPTDQPYSNSMQRGY